MGDFEPAACCFTKISLSDAHFPMSFQISWFSEHQKGLLLKDYTTKFFYGGHKNIVWLSRRSYGCTQQTMTSSELTIISHHFNDKGCQILKHCDMVEFKRTLEIRLKVFDKIQVKVGKMKITKRQSRIFNDPLKIANLCNLNLELSNSH